MTNVPDNLRDLWKEIYILFDKHFMMDPSREEDWKAFWDDGKKIHQKYEQVPCVVELLATVADMLAKISCGRNGNAQQ